MPHFDKAVLLTLLN